MLRFHRELLYSLLLSSFSLFAYAAPACSVPLPQASTAAQNIFNGKQEQILGDVLAEMDESDLKFVHGPGEDEITRIGQKLIATLPANSTHYQFHVYESGEINAFSTTGGRIYISRKLLTAVRNEDELAGVIAHEIGHLYMHHVAVNITRMLRLRLNITTVGDRADITEKMNRLFSTAPSRKEKDAEDDDEEVKDEISADQLSMYALLRAGYQPQSTIAFLDTITLNKGKNGNFLSDLFGFTSEVRQRIHAGTKFIATLPIECRQPAQPTESFRAWQKSMIDAGALTSANSIQGETTLKLESPLRPSLWNIQFSPDGRSVLAQDENNITLIDHTTSKVLFQIDATDANRAYFTPDSSTVVFNTDTLRVEQWDVASGQRTSVHEMVVYDDCSSTWLSPDGRTLVCTRVKSTSDSIRIGLRLIDVATNNVLWERSDFAELLVNDDYYISWQPVSFSPYIRISQDERYLIYKAFHQVMFYDLQTRQVIDVPGKLKDLVISTNLMAFIGPDTLLIQAGENNKLGVAKAQVYHLPEGNKLEDTLTVYQPMQSSVKGHLLVISGMKDYTMGIMDYKEGKFIGTMNSTASSLMDYEKNGFIGTMRSASCSLWEDQIAMENGVGGVSIQKIGDYSATPIKLPLGQLPPLRSVLFSEDGHYLAVSLRSRAEIWDLQTGKRISTTRPFQNGWIDTSGQMFAQFPKYQERDPKTLKMTLDPFTSTELHGFDGNQKQYRNLELSYKANGRNKSIDTHATLQAKRMETGNLVWSASYTHETPSVWGTPDGHLALAWDVVNQTAKDEIKKYPALQTQIAAFKNPKLGILLETVDAYTGKSLQQVAIPETDLASGWKEVDRAIVFGEWVMLIGNHNDTVIYSFESGSKIGQFFGYPLAVDNASGTIAAGNRDDEIELIDAATAKEIQRFHFGTAVRAAHLTRTDKGKSLMVLTSDQVMHTLILP